MLDFGIRSFHSFSAPTGRQVPAGASGTVVGSKLDGLPALQGCTFLPGDTANVQTRRRSFRIVTSVLEETRRTELGQAVRQADFNYDVLPGLEEEGALQVAPKPGIRKQRSESQPRSLQKDWSAQRLPGREHPGVKMEALEGWGGGFSAPEHIPGSPKDEAASALCGSLAYLISCDTNTKNSHQALIVPRMATGIHFVLKISLILYSLQDFCSVFGCPCFRVAFNTHAMTGPVRGSLPVGTRALASQLRGTPAQPQVGQEMTPRGCDVKTCGS